MITDNLSSYNPEGSDLRRAQMRMQEILDVFHGICTKHGIDYWLSSGTLLGARRHGGFIPWDDDLDVLVMQRDYKKLLRILEQELPENLKLQTRETDPNYPLFWAKIRDLHSVYHEEASEGYTYKGIFIDVFPFEPLPPLWFKKEIDKYIMSPMYFAQSKSAFKKAVQFVRMMFLPLAQLIVYVTRKIYRRTGSKLNTYSYGIPTYTNYNMKHFLPPGKIMFEGKNYLAPHDVDNCLSGHFGSDYMELPKVAERRTHALKIEVK